MVDGIQPSSSPYVVWSPVGGVNGTIVVSDADHSSVLTKRANGQSGQWEIHTIPQPAAYSRSLHVFDKHPDYLMILSAGVFGGYGKSYDKDNLIMLRSTGREATMQGKASLRYRMAESKIHRMKLGLSPTRQSSWMSSCSALPLSIERNKHSPQRIFISIPPLPDPV